MFSSEASPHQLQPCIELCFSLVNHVRSCTLMEFVMLTAAGGCVGPSHSLLSAAAFWCMKLADSCHLGLLNLVFFVQEAIEQGTLSSLQLETICYACQCHEHFLAGRKRAGFFIGDGAGVGKVSTCADTVWQLLHCTCLFWPGH